ncbi:MAG: UDP-3-O-(3-hydroxymyristoyl)glucosamine N-acyltransferase [Pseudomonadales bacterium]|nr:UDP-3-O-(3-hydroxymyristoyl)glucosamine N-acyltransferase [Pseudomonadales bacterium]
MRGKARYSLGDLATYLEAELKGDPQCEIIGMAGLPEAQKGQISFLSDSAYESQLEATQASAVILEPQYADRVTNALISTNPYLGFAKVSQLFENRPKPKAGIHTSAVIADSAKVHKTAAIGPYVIIEEGVSIAEQVEVGAGSFIGVGTTIGKGSRIAANVTIHHRVEIGEEVIIHSGAVIGADGFGFAHDGNRWEKISQLGGVHIGPRVEVGANTTVDRGALADTVIEEGVKIDNQVMVAHNVKIGAHTAIAACVGISGSTEIGRNCTLAGGVGLVGHIKLTDRVHVTGMTMVTKSIDQAGSYSSGTAMMPTGLWRKNSVRIKHLDELSKRIRELEKQLKELTSNKT